MCKAKNQPIKICKIQNFCLPIGPALTVIFGANRSGKSSYSRVLGFAGIMRGEVEVIANINDQNCMHLTPRRTE
jgi:ABC-type transport system involved in cytochrome c biogenesis ATPase subunit